MKRRLVSSLAAAGFALSAATAAWADAASDKEAADEMLAGGAWTAGPRVPCADGVVAGVHPRLEEAASDVPFSSGIVVEIKLPTKPRFLNGQAFGEASVVHYDQERGNGSMKLEKPGDRVHVCLVSFPTPSRDPKTGQVFCDPNTDPRGVVYRVYDYHRHFTYAGPDSQHSCGGA